MSRMSAEVAAKAARLTELAERAAAEGRRLGADVAAPGFVDLSAEIQSCRRPFRPEEVRRLRALAADLSEVFEASADRVRPGMTEWEVAGLLSGEALARGAQVAVLLVGADERARRWRHPLMAGRRVERYVLMGMVVQRGGLHAALSRAIHFGPLPDELRRRQEAVTGVLAALVDRCRPGVRLREALAAAQEAYAAAGFPEEWRRHHQGGTIGYLPREQVATPASEVELVAEQACAWNPTVEGAKAEETVLVAVEGPEILTCTPSWPEIRHRVGGTVVLGAGILTR